MDVLKISGILDERRKQSEILYNSLIENIDDVFNTLLERADIIKDIQLITEAEDDKQTIEDVLKSLNYVTSQIDKHLVKHKKFYGDKNIIGGGRVITWVDGPIFNKFKDSLKSFKDLIKDFQNKLPEDAMVGTPTPRSSTKLIKLKDEAGKDIKLLITSSDPVNKVSDTELTIGSNSVELT